MKRNAILSLFAAISLAATLAVAGTGGDGECNHDKGGHEKGERGHGRHDRGEMFRKHLDELDLSADQKKKVDAIFADAKKDRESGRGSFRDEYKKLHEMLEAEKPDEKAIYKQVDEISEMKAAQHKAMLKTLLAVRAELTPEQREKLKAMRPKHGEHRRHGGPKGDHEGHEKPEAEADHTGE